MDAATCVVPPTTERAVIRWRWPAISSGVAKIIALVGHAETQAGSSPCVVRSGHRSHLWAFFVAGSALTPPKGQTTTHIQQPTHLLVSTRTASVSTFRVIAPIGQAEMQAASWQCWQREG